MWVSYGASWLGFATGMIALRGQGWTLGLPPLLASILPELFPYVPTIFGPIVLGQAAIFLLGTARLTRAEAISLSLLGISALLGISFVALGIQLAGQLGELGGLGLLLAGSTFIGYLLISASWLPRIVQERAASSTE